jgi:hypothetical protein
MDLIEYLKDYWTILAAFTGIVYSYATLKMQNEDQEKRISILEKESKELNPVLIEIRTKLASIEATLHMLCQDKRNDK